MLTTRTRTFIRPALILIGMIPLIALIAFMLAYGKSEYPFGDTNVTSVITALKSADGSLTAQNLLDIHYGHRMIFSRALTALATLFTDWDTRIEVWSNVILGVLNWLILIGIFNRYHPQKTAWFILPAGIFILTTDQAINWLAGVHNVWHFALFFSLLSVLSLTYTTQKWRSVILAVLFGYCATFSMAAGLAVWGVIVIALISLNYRDWRQYIIVLIAGGIAVGLYFNNTSMGGGFSSPHYGRIIPPDMLTFIQFVLMLFGRPLINDFTIAPFIGGLGIIFFWVNIILYWRRHQNITAIGVWLPIAAYSVGNAILLAISRHHYFGTSIALTERYLHPTLPLWGAIFAVCIINSQPKRILAGINIVFMVAMIALHAITLSQEWAYLEFDLPVDGVQIQGDCLSRFPISQYTGCWDASKHAPNIANMQLAAAWRLAGYARIPQTMILSPYTGDKIIINTETIWQGIHIRDFLHRGANHDDVLHIATDGQQGIFTGEISHIPSPPRHALFGFNPENVATITDFIGADDAFWYITRPQLYADETLWEYRAWAEGIFAPARRIVTDDNVIITRYIRPFETSEIATFGNDIRLMGYQFVGDTDFGACDSITLQTAWMTDNTRNQSIQLSLALTDDPITRAITTTDSALSAIPIQFWEVDKAYYDERHLTLPCDLPSGNYLLTLTVYPISDGGDILPNLSVTDTELRVDGHLLVINAVIIR